MVQLTDELVEGLDRQAERRGLSRSALIREALEEHLRNDVEQEISRQIVEGYRRIPPAVPDEWGDLHEAADAAAREVAQRLDAEEDAAGHGAW